jgi:hypothetical protein
MHASNISVILNFFVQWDLNNLQSASKYTRL